MERENVSLAIGDRAPNFVLPDESGRYAMFYERTQGRPVVLLLLPEAASAESGAVLAAFRGKHRDFLAAGLDVFCVCDVLPCREIDAPAGDMAEGLQIWWDQTGKILTAYLPGPSNDGQGRAHALLLDANQRVLARLQDGAPALPEQVLAFYRGLPPSRPSIRRMATAPVLMLPRLLPALWCERLRRAYDDRRGVSSGGPGLPAGRAVVLASSMDAETLRALQSLLGRRLAPEVLKAFSFKSFKLSDLVVTSGMAAARRDGSFALVVNLSPEAENEAGDRRATAGFLFPEYHTAAYCPPAGGGLIYSADLLVEPKRPVSSGRYYLQALLRG